jgi:crotonobetaine/carnitine-CoA ligase
MLNSQPPSPDDAGNPLRKIYAVPMPKEFRADFERRFGVTMQEAYGATEDGLVLSTSWDEAFPAGSCGKPCDLYDVDIVDENDMPCPPGVSGEIVVRPREPYAMMSGYFKMPEATLSAFRNLWFHTGDRGVKDDKGWFFFQDRMKDAIRRRGENISSYEVERVINAHPKVAESAVIPVPSELGEDEVKAVVILKEGETLDPAELVSFCEKGMARFAVPRFVEYLSELPRTPTQKIEKYKLRKAGITTSTWDRDKAGYRLGR